MLNIKRILTNYKYMMEEKLKTETMAGRIEFLKEEIERVKQALALGVSINDKL